MSGTRHRWRPGPAPAYADTDPPRPQTDTAAVQKVVHAADGVSFETHQEFRRLRRAGLIFLAYGKQVAGVQRPDVVLTSALVQRGPRLDRRLAKRRSPLMQVGVPRLSASHT